MSEILFIALIATFALPTGNVFGFPLKLTLLGLSVLMMLPRILDKRLLKDRGLLGFAGILVLLIGWTLLARHNGFVDTTLDCLKQFVSLIGVVSVGWIGWRIGVLSKECIISALRWTALASVILKFVVEIVIIGQFAVLPGMNPTDSMIAILARIFGAQLATCEIPFGFFSLHRVMLANDVFVLAVLPFELLRPQSLWRRTMVIAGAASFVLLTYSRVVMLQFLLMLLVCIFATVPRRRWLHCLGWTMIVFAVLAPIGWKVASPMLYDRFFSANAIISDSARVVQLEAIADGIAKHPLCGYGTGSYVHECVRGHGAERYSYELQYLSFIYQFGFVGFILVIGGIVFLCFRLCLEASAKGMVRVVVWFNLIVWALKPLFNPQFLSSNSASVIVATLFLGMNGYESHD